ncbi:MAG: acetate--CoA ligase [Acidobacteria bacterium]|nr:acetate--CoA ligase [Acidobacteriota bacterium]
MVDLYELASRDRLAFWAEQARKLHWDEPFSQTLDFSDAPFAKWFADGKINASYNCLDRHVLAGLGDRTALLFEGEPGDTQTFSYAELLRETKKAANALLSLGISAGDRVAIYSPMIPETIIAMLAVARIGAVHSVVFGGFSAEALRNRILDAGAKLVITADGGFRKGKVHELKVAVDQALSDNACPSVENTLVIRRTNSAVTMSERDLWWHDVVSTASPEHVAMGFEAEHPLFILYTSGTTGKPKGILHTTGGYLTGASFTHRTVFDLKAESDIYWCTADVGWITGHSYVVYGPLANAATQVIYEGTPDTPSFGRWWEIIAKYKVSIFYTAPTAIRTFMKVGRDVIAGHDLSSLRILGSVGEPINPEAWHWYHDVIGNKNCEIVDTWWQTETGSIMISAIPGAFKTKPGAAQKPLPGITVGIVDEAGVPVKIESDGSAAGYLTIDEPWPSMLRGVWGDPERFKETYWNKFPGKYFAGDGARYDSEGDIWILGRIDDVIKVSGHRLSTAEIESALVEHHWVAEAAVVGAKDEITDQAVVAFVVLRQDEISDAPAEGDMAKILKDWVVQKIGAIARPRQIMVVSELPKTRSGKIMRRLLRDVAEGRAIGDVTTLADSTVMASIKEKMETESHD